jgi:hypothetical protein
MIWTEKWPFSSLKLGKPGGIRNASDVRYSNQSRFTLISERPAPRRGHFRATPVKHKSTRAFDSELGCQGSVRGNSIIGMEWTEWAGLIALLFQTLRYAVG